VRRVAAPEAAAPGLDYLHTMAADQEGYALAAVVNRQLAGGLGLSLRFPVSSLPFLNEWKMLNEVDYVVGFEPVNTKIVNRAVLRSEGRLPEIEPGGERVMEVEFGVLEGAAEIDAFAERVRRAST
jgi:hypothetical protein